MKEFLTFVKTKSPDRADIGYKYGKRGFKLIEDATERGLIQLNQYGIRSYFLITEKGQAFLKE